MNSRELCQYSSLSRNETAIDWRPIGSKKFPTCGNIVLTYATPCSRTLDSYSVERMCAKVVSME
jgi:hypothetical protein